MELEYIILSKVSQAEKRNAACSHSLVEEKQVDHVEEQ
jgi:hypothetical protein